MVQHGHKVYVQKDAGVGSGFPDSDYIQAGAQILPTIKDVYDIAEMIVKVKEPIEPEYQLIKKDQVIFTYFHFASDRPLTDAMLNDASNPYNTRVNTGLPPTPISNPGESAIKAAMNPPEGDWLYFVTVNLTTGETKFAATEDEFWKLRDEYKNSNSNAN